MRYFKCLFLLVTITVLFSCNGQPKKINGVSFVAARAKADSTHVKPVVNINANYAAVMPFGFTKNLNDPTINHNTNRQWFGETKAGAKQYIEELRKANIKIMIKPQIWVYHGEFTGLIAMKNETDWKALEASYTSFIMTYVELAKETNAEIFCIGTELELFVKHRPNFWLSLIKKIKEVYKGKLTYAANWDEYKRTPFWGQLDFIGVDAYFPVSNLQTPTFEDCIEGWKTHKPILKAMADQHQKPILFTEFGYRSVDYAGREPWVSDYTMTDVNMQAQVNTTKALFETFWKDDWFAGGFIWKWFIKHNEVGGKEDPMFTPQNKPVENVIKAYYKS